MKQDILNRAVYTEKLVNIIETLANKHNSSCFAIDGKWGIGKTYVLEMLETALKNIQSEETQDDKYFVFHYNCWEYDYYDEPSIAIISAMLNEVEKMEALGKLEEFAKSSWAKAKMYIGQIAGEFSKNKIGINIVETIQDINDETYQREESKYKFDELYTFRKTLDNARTKLEELAEEKSIVLIVDELDRCIPSYAIKVMERLHHLFDGVSNITVIMAVDKSQLEQSVKQIYGDSVDVDKYLKKFIDFSLILDNGEISEEFEEKYNEFFKYFSFADNDKVFLTELFKTIFSDIDIRTQEKIMAKAKLIHELVKERFQYEPSLLCFEILYLTLSHIIGDRNLEKIFNESLIKHRAISIDIENILGENISDLLKKISNDCCSGINVNILEKEYAEITSDLYGRTFWICYSQYNEIKGNICGRLYIEKDKQPSKEVEAAKRFVAVAKIML